MQPIQPIQEKKKPLNRWWFFLWGFMAGLLVAGFFAIIILLVSAPIRNVAVEPTINPIPDARVVLTVAPDGCGVERSEVTGSSQIDNLTWVVRDVAGYSVLERFAEGETKYRYFVGGSYTVSIKAWYEGSYHTISNEVNIDC